MNVLSLFDGMSCGRIALDRANIPVKNYYASEVDKHAIAVSQKNYPNTIQLGDVNNWRTWEVEWSKIDLLIGGSPCQGFSSAGKRLAFNDPRSALFFTYVDILEHIKTLNPRIKFMLENVKMKRDHIKIINECLGVRSVLINSAMVSAQNRKRYYWANWDFSQPVDKEITWGHVAFDDASCISRFKPDKLLIQLRSKHGNRVKGVRFFNDGYRPFQGDKRKSGLSEVGRVCFSNGKTQPVLTGHRPKVFDADFGYRPASCSECCRLQTVDPIYFANTKSTDTQVIKMLGNGWTVDVIAHILSHLQNQTLDPKG